MATSGVFYDPVKGRLVPSDDMAEIGSSVQPFKNVTATTLTGAVVGNVTGNITGNVTGNVTGYSTLEVDTAGPTSGALTTAMSGRLCIGVVDAAYTLPAPTAGVWYTIITGVASAGTGLTITATGPFIQGKTTAAGTTAITDATTLTNSGASDVVGDYVILRSNGTSWWVVGQSGTYAGS